MKGNIKMALQYTGFVIVDWNKLAHGMDSTIGMCAVSVAKFFILKLVL